MRSILLLVSALVLGCGAEPKVAVTPQSRQAFVQSLIDSTVQIKVECEEGNSSGTGVFIRDPNGKAYLATANHVVDVGCYYTANGNAYTVTARDEEHDIAILHGPVGKNIRTITLAPPYLGMEVWAIGYPKQWPTGKTGLQVTHGVLSAFVKEQYKISAEIYFGSSGGPVFDSAGRLVGLSVSLWQRGGAPLPGEYFLTPAWRVMELGGGPAVQ